MLVFAATSRYLQGPGLLDDIGKHATVLGQRPVIVADADVVKLFGERLLRSFESVGHPAQMLVCPNEITLASIEALKRQAREFGADLVVGVGGGKSIDTAKGVARLLSTRFVSVPTIASNDGPASAAVAIYDEHHALIEVQQLVRNPDLVLVDTQAIVSAPLRFLRAGIGDAISKRFEAEACERAQAATLFGGRPSGVGMAIARASYDVIRRHGAAALKAAEQREVTPDVEALVEATVLLSTLAFENGGLSIAHAVARGLPMVPRAAGTLHGAHVAYGLLVQVMLEGRPDVLLDELAGCYAELGLPTRLADFGLDEPTAAELNVLVDGAMGSPSVRRFERQLTADDVAGAIAAVEQRFR